MPLIYNNLWHLYRRISIPWAISLVSFDCIYTHLTSSLSSCPTSCARVLRDSGMDGWAVLWSQYCHMTHCTVAQTPHQCRKQSFMICYIHTWKKKEIVSLLLCCLMTLGLSKNIRCHVWPYIFPNLANHQIKHQATQWHRVGCQPGDCIWLL